MVKTDRHSLKFLFTQKMGIPSQQQWVSKLFGYDVLIEYRADNTNTVVDALSRRQTGELVAISTPIADWVTQLQSEHAMD